MGIWVPPSDGARSPGLFRTNYRVVCQLEQLSALRTPRPDGAASHGGACWLLVFLSFFAVPAIAHSQSDMFHTIRGRVISRGGDPITAAEATILGSAVTAQTDSSGWFQLAGVPSGVAVLRVRRIGFNPQYLRVNLGSAASLRIEIMLDPGPQILPEITVTAKEAKPVEFAWTTKYDDFFRRHTLGLPGGTFVSGDDIKRRPAIHTAELIEQYVPGARLIEHFLGVGGTEIKFPRCDGGHVGVWIDGRKVNWQPEYQRAVATSLLPGKDSEEKERARKRATELADVLNDINPSQIQFMEVYRGIGSIPGEFSGGCGAIAIWTK